MNTCTQTRPRFGPEKRAGKQNQIVTKNRIIKDFLSLGLLSVLSYSQPNPEHCVKKSSIYYQIMLDFQFIEVVPAWNLELSVPISWKSGQSFQPLCWVINRYHDTYKYGTLLIPNVTRCQQYSKEV